MRHWTRLLDACVAPFFLMLIGDPRRWLATVPDLHDGEVVDVDALVEGFDVSPFVGAPRRERPAMDDGRCVAWARDLGLVVVSVDSRLAPEHPFPAALDDGEFHEVPGAPHGFDALAPDVPLAPAFMARQTAFLRERLGS